MTLKLFACLSVFCCEIKVVKYFISHMFSLGSLQSLSHNNKFILDKFVPTISSEIMLKTANSCLYGVHPIKLCNPFPVYFLLLHHDCSDLDELSMHLLLISNVSKRNMKSHRLQACCQLLLMKRSTSLSNYCAELAIPGVLSFV